jgi:hypothetical protein
MSITNTGGSAFFGVSSSATGLIPGAAVYSTCLSTTNATELDFGTNNIARLTIGSTGNITIAAPSAGSVLTISQGATGGGGIAGVLITASAANLAQLILAGNAATAGTSSFDLFQAGDNTANIVQRANAAMNIYTNNTLRMTLLSTGELSLTAPIITKGYTVAGLPAGTLGMIAHVTDALGPTYLTAVVGGGAVKTPVFYNGAAWVCA